MDASPTKASTEPSADRTHHEYEFVGWVPTANGRLSFRHVGDARHPDICKYANASGGQNHDRVVFGFQKRNLSDLLFARITEALTGRSGEFWFVLSCRTGPASYGDVDSLRGQIYIFESRESWSKLGKNAADARVNEINRLRLNRNNFSEIEDVFAKATSEAESHADISVFFELFRDGEVRFTAPRFSDVELAIDSEEYGNERGVSFAKWASDQAYFFLRDLCHVHQHHSPHVDTILILQHFNGDDLKWRNNIIYSLHHYIIKMKRTSHTVDLHRALGVLGYAKSFYEICGARDAKLADDMSAFSYEAIKSSLQSKIGENDARDTADSNKKNWAIADTVGYRNLLIASLVLIFSAVTFTLQPYVAKKPKKLEDIGEIIINNWALWVPGVFFLFVFLWFLLSEGHFRRSFYKKNTFYQKDFVALAILSPRVIGLISTAASAIIALSVVLYIFYKYGT